MRYYRASVLVLYLCVACHVLYAAKAFKPINFTARSISNFDIDAFGLEFRQGLAQNMSFVNLTTPEGCTPLIEAAKLGHHRHVEILLQTFQHAHPNMTEAKCIGGKTALHFAAICTNQHESNVKHSICPDHLSQHQSDADDSHEQVVLQLLSAGAQVDAADEESRTPLHYAALNGHADVLVRLLDAGANANARDRSNWTPLYYASQRGDEEATSLLVKHTNDINQVDWAGATPLIHACQIGHEGVARILLEAGVSPWVRDHQLKHALDYAKNRGTRSLKLTQLLHSYMDSAHTEL